MRMAFSVQTSLQRSLDWYIFRGTRFPHLAIPPSSFRQRQGLSFSHVFFRWLTNKVERKKMYGFKLIIMLVDTFGQTITGSDPAVSFLGPLIFWTIVRGVGVWGTALFHLSSLRNLQLWNSDERFPILVDRSLTHRISTIPLDVQAEDLSIYIDMAQRTTSSCIQGWGGQVFVNRRDKSYGEFDEYTANIINNTGCSQPCILKKKSISHCNLNPGPFQRLMCAFVVEAWRVIPLYAQPMQPHKFQITCDGFIMGKVQW